MAEEKTRAELSTELAEERRKSSTLEERLARLEAAFAKPAEPDLATLARLKDAEAELATLRPNAARVAALPRGPAPKLEPYKGLVRAKVDCTYDGYHRGPVIGLNEHKQSVVLVEGEVFHVELAAFWSDNPYEPVREVRNPDGTVRYEPRTDVSIVDYRWRLKLQTTEELQARAV